MLELDLRNRHPRYRLDLRRLRRLTEALLGRMFDRQRSRRREEADAHPRAGRPPPFVGGYGPSGAVGISFVGRRRMSLLNACYLGHTGSTDVLAFDYADADASQTPGLLHGELFICLDDAHAQARQFHTSWSDEVVRYLVHGLLHLQGHDDLEAAPRRRMKREEDRWVRWLRARFPLSKLGPVARLHP